MPAIVKMCRNCKHALKTPFEIPCKECKAERIEGVWVFTNWEPKEDVSDDKCTMTEEYWDMMRPFGATTQRVL